MNKHTVPGPSSRPEKPFTGLRVLVKRLATDADVLVENFRTGVMQNLGLGYEELTETNPSLVYCSMTGFGHTGPKAMHPAYDNVIQAYSGLMSTTGSDVTGPVKIGPPVLDFGTGAQAALAISAALSMARTPATAAGAPPRWSEHTAEVLAEIGLSEVEILQLSDAGVI